MKNDTLALNTYAEYQKYNFFRTPDWRWERVLSIVDRPGEKAGRCTRRDDAYVRKARNFVLRYRDGDQDVRERLMFENVGLEYAYKFHLNAIDDPETSMYVQARLLARQTPEQIADIMGMMPTAIEWYSLLFFDVIPYLNHRDWITKQIIIPAMRRQKERTDTDVSPFKDSTVVQPFLDGSLKLFAYFGGPHVIDLLMTSMKPGKPVLSSDDVEAWLDKTWTTSIRQRSSQAARLFEINKYNVVELFTIHSRIMEIEKSEDALEQNKTTHERHVKAMVDEIPWCVGADGERIYKGTVVGRFDNMPAELRDDELLKLASGQTVTTIKDNFPDKLPAPRKEKKAVLLSNVELP